MLLSPNHIQVSEQIATVCAMVSVGSSIFYRPKVGLGSSRRLGLLPCNLPYHHLTHITITQDKAVFADNAHKNFSRGGVGDHIALMSVYDGWAESNFSTQWCFENYVQVGVRGQAGGRRGTCEGEDEAGGACLCARVCKATLLPSVRFHGCQACPQAVQPRT